MSRYEQQRGWQISKIKIILFYCQREQNQNQLGKIYTKKLDVLLGRLLGSQNDIHRQLGGNHQPPPTQQPQAALVIDAQSWTALLPAFSSHLQP